MVNQQHSDTHQGQTSTSELEIMIRARYPVILIQTWEEDRATDQIRFLSKKLNKRLFGWSIARGLIPLDMGPNERPLDNSSADPQYALRRVQEIIDPSLFVFYDFHPFLKDPAIVRLLRDVAKNFKQSFKSMILVSPQLKIPIDLEKEITVCDFDLPDQQSLGELFDEIQAELSTRDDLQVDVSPETRERLIQATLGLTLVEAENVFARAVVVHGGLTLDALPLIIAEKEQQIRQSGMLEFYTSTEDLENVGGLESLKEWLRKRMKSFSRRAQEFGLPAPRGILLIGVQGCGKSLTAKAVANFWRLPLLRLDTGALFTSLVGSSEDNMRRAIHTAERVSPAILWIDEIEKGFTGIQSSGQLDSGTSARVFGTFITWLQEKTKPVFVIATANDISKLPPEMLRKGRFDDIFFIDLPSSPERLEIFRIHLAKRGYTPEEFDLAALAAASLEFSGAEIESAIVSAMFDVFDSSVNLDTKSILKALQETMPLSRVMKEQVEMLRNWAQGRVRRASQREHESF